MEQKPKEETEWEARERLGEKPFDKPKWEVEFATQRLFFDTQSKYEAIKGFITSLLQRQKEELVKKVQDRLVGFEDTSFEPQYKDYNNGYNQALEETIRIIKDLEV